MSSQSRQILSLDPGWRFHLGDISLPLPNTHIAAYMANKAGWARGAAKPTYDDSGWRDVNLPHDWSVEGTFDPNNHVDAGFLPRGIGWYRRYFTLDESDRGKNLSITFDGVATHCTAYVNGHLLHRNFCGYTPFTIDISDVANFGEDQVNCIAVRVDATHPEGWWYEGAGIYRHVWLVKTNPVHVATVGTFVTTKLRGRRAEVTIATTVVNESDEAVHVRLESFVRGMGVSPARKKSIGAGGTPTPHMARTRFRLDPRRSVEIKQRIDIANPRFWSPDEPNLYQLCTALRRGSKVIDSCDTTFGVRTLRWDSKRGLVLNGKPLKLLGTCNHQDHAGVGVAVPDSIHAFRIQRLKDMGCYACRCAHNPPAPELLDACDRLGMLVIDETRNFGSAPEQMAQLRSMVLRDRNHPSVILWSICNEEAIQGTPVGASIARAMQAEVKKLDPSRPVTAAVSGGILNDDCIATEIEVMGINYQIPVHSEYHAKHPRTPLIASETHCALATRGVYKTDPERFVFASYDEDHAPWGATARQTWRDILARPYIAGLFVWTGFDYRGEPSPHAWPCVNSHFGILDTCGFEKDSFYLHKAWFTRAGEPFVHVLPHWNWRGREGEAIRVLAYTNCDEVELFLNERSLSRKRVDPIEMAQWSVPFAPGALKALAFRQGTAVAQCVVETTGDPVSLGLEIHPSINGGHEIPADDQFALPITVFATDVQGRRVPTASNLVGFGLAGPGRILGVGNGDPTCHEPDKGSSRSFFNGLAQVIVQTSGTPGTIALRATASNLAPAELRIATTPPIVARRIVSPAPRRYFITDWRMSPITPRRPDPNLAIAEQDMNSWQRIDPAQGPQKAWEGRSGFAIYRATFTPPKAMQSTGGRIVMPCVIGSAELFLNGAPVGKRDDPRKDPMSIEFPASGEKFTISVLLRSRAAPAGLARAAELVVRE